VVLCRTADRYVELGKRLSEERRRIRDVAFGLQSAEQQRTKRPRIRRLNKGRLGHS
jgi:hypothetical protein